MKETLAYVTLFALIVGLLILGGWSVFQIQGGNNPLNCGKATRLSTAVLAVILGIAASVYAYPAGPGLRVLGFPFPGAVFQRDASGSWLDYVGPLTLPILIFDAAVVVGLVHTIAVVVIRLRSRGRREVGAV